MPDIKKKLKIHCDSFKNGEYIPAKYTCEGEEINPSFQVSEWPDETQTLALIMEDPDASHETFYHWIVWNIVPGSSINEYYEPGIVGQNSDGNNKYKGPCPPSGTHRYFFKFYALDTSLNLLKDADINALREAMYGHVIAESEFMGLFEKGKSS